MNPIVILSLIMAAYSANQYWKYRQRSRLMFTGFWSLLAVEAATGLSILLIPVAFFLVSGLYYKFILKDSFMKETKLFLDEQGVTKEEIDQAYNDYKTEEKTKKLMEQAEERKQKELEAARAEFLTTPVKGFTDITIQNRMERVFCTDTGEKLIMNIGEIKAAVRMSFRPERTENDEVDTIQLHFRVADENGTTWACNSFLQPYLMTDPLGADTEDSTSGFVHWKDAPSPWKQAIKQTCLIAGVLNLLDSRDRKDLKIGNTEYKIYFKYQGPRTDVAYLDTSSSFIIRISELYHDIYKGEEFIDREEMPPFCFEIPSEQFLFPLSHDYYYTYYEEWYSVDEGKERTPLIFKHLQEIGMPQNNVRILKA